MLPPALFPDLSTPSWLICGISFHHFSPVFTPLPVHSESWIQISNPALGVLSVSHVPCPSGILTEQDNPPFSRLPLGCQDSPEKGDTTRQDTSVRACLWQPGSALPGRLPVSCELFASHIFDVDSNFCFSPQTLLCSLVLIDSSERIETI